jgi:hypothetical protein
MDESDESGLGRGQKKRLKKRLGKALVAWQLGQFRIEAATVINYDYFLGY